MVHCVYAHPFGSELIYLYRCTLLQFFRKFFALFYFLRLEKAGKTPSQTNNTAVLSLVFFFTYFCFPLRDRHKQDCLVYCSTFSSNQEKQNGGKFLKNRTCCLCD